INEALVTNSKHHRSPYISTTFMRFPCWLSLLNRLLCLSFNDLRFTKTKINSFLTDKQKPRPEKLKRLIDLTNRLLISAIQAQKLVVKILIEPAAQTSRLPEN
ncbi:hypothetical protein M2G70_22895, partial [Vibrio vulnificus]|nr:hypothetical protein [Vibrio vulnificus]